MADEKTPEEYIAMYEPAMDPIIGATYYRIAGACTFRGDYETMLNFVKAENAVGKYGGVLKEDTWPLLLTPIKPIARRAVTCSLWKDVNMSEPGAFDDDKITINIWLFGIEKLINRTGPFFNDSKVLLMREDLWTLYILRARLEDMLGLPRYSLALFR